MCARTNLAVIKAGVYKIPIKLTSYADDGIEGLFDLKLEQSTPGVALRKHQINLKEGAPKAILLAITDPSIFKNE